MKKIFNLLSVIAVAISFTACHPLDNTYKELGDLPSPEIAPSVVTTSVTLSAADYGLLPTTNYAKTSFYFKTLDDAKTSIPVILAAKYPRYADKSSVIVTYANVPTTIKVADSSFVNVSYTVQPTDYTFTNFSAAQVLTFLGVKYPTPVANQLAVLTFNFFENGANTNAVTQSFLYLNNAWTRIYHVSAAQYASVGKGGNNNNFAAADATLIPSYLNTFLKADPSVSVTAKVGDVRYVSYKYYGGSTANTFQRVQPLTYDGTNWVTTPQPAAPLAFAKNNGTWVADNTVNYTLTPADHVTLTTYTFGSAAARANLASFKSVDLRTTSSTSWTSAEIANAVAEFAKNTYKTPEQNQIFNLSYYGYTGTYAYYVVKLKYVGTAFVIQ